jgi:hypothetical protein
VRRFHLRYYCDLSFHDFQFACIELTLMTQGIQPMVWHQFEDVDMKEQL